MQWRFSEVLLRPVVTLADAEECEHARPCTRDAEKLCFIAPLGQLPGPASNPSPSLIPAR